MKLVQPSSTAYLFYIDSKIMCFLFVEAKLLKASTKYDHPSANIYPNKQCYTSKPHKAKFPSLSSQLHLRKNSSIVMENS